MSLSYHVQCANTILILEYLQKWELKEEQEMGCPALLGNTRHAAIYCGHGVWEEGFDKSIFFSLS